MKISINTLVLILFSVVLASCDGDYRKAAVGEFSHATVVMDSTQWDSETANAIRSVYGSGIRTLPNVEPRFDLQFMDFSTNEKLEELKRRKNLIIASPIDSETNVGQFVRSLLADDLESRVRQGESFAYSFEDKWYRDQWAMVLTSTSDSALADRIEGNQQRLVNSLMDKEMRRWEYELFEKGERYDVAEDSLWNKYGWKVRIQHDYYINLDTTYAANRDSLHFLTMRRRLPANDRWFWAWWKEDVHNIDYLDKEWINAKRDSLMERFIRGSRDSSYVTTEYRRPVNTTSFRLNGDLAYETLGTWRMTNDAMGGQFVNLTIYDEETRRLFILEYGQFAPKYNKRRFRRHFRAMIRTFESDSTWNSVKPMASN